MDRIHELLLQSKLENGGPVLYVTRVPEDAPPPDAVARRRLDTLMPTVTDCCSSYHVVLEGSGFAAAAKRGILVSAFQIRWRKGLFFVHANLGAVAQSVPIRDRAVLGVLVDRATREGLTTCRAPRAEGSAAAGF